MQGFQVDSMALALMALVVLQFACLIIITLFRRSLGEFDKHNEVQDRRLNSHAETLIRIDKHMARVEEYMDNSKSSREERSRQMESLGRKIDSIIQGRATH